MNPAFNRCQLVNQLYHALAAFLIVGAVREIGFWNPTVTALLAVAVVAFAKEWIESLYRYSQRKEIHVLDGILDVVVWLTAGTLAVWLWR